MGRTRARARGSSTQSINTFFRSHPIAAPVICIVIGAASLAVLSFFADVSQTAPGSHVHVPVARAAILLGLSVIILAIGIVTLPIGIITAARRRANPLVLRCPACGHEEAGGRPFLVERPAKMQYALATCPVCHWEFTVNRFAKLR